MSPISFFDVEYGSKRKQTRREIFLAEMDAVIPWARRMALIEPVYPKAGNGRRPYALETMLRIHFMQQRFALSDPTMEESLYDVVSMRRFAGLSLSRGSMPDETTILNFRHLLEKNSAAARLLTEVNALLSERGLLLRQGTIFRCHQYQCTKFDEERKRKMRSRDASDQEGQSVALWDEGTYRCRCRFCDPAGTDVRGIHCQPVEMQAVLQYENTPKKSHLKSQYQIDRLIPVATETSGNQPCNFLPPPF